MVTIFRGNKELQGKIVPRQKRFEPLFLAGVQVQRAFKLGHWTPCNADVLNMHL